MLLSLVVALGAGVVSFLAPCTVPLLPAYVGVLSGAAAGVPEAEQPARLLRGALLYVAGFTAVFVALGVTVSSVTRAIRTPDGLAQRAGGAVVLVLAALLLLDARLGVLARLSGGDRGRSRLASSTSWWAPLLLGVVFGTAFTPCVGPFLGAVLTLGALEGETWRAAALLTAYGLGLGIPFVLASLGIASSARLARTLTRVSRPLSVVGAVMLLVLGGALVAGEYDRVAGWFVQVLPFPAV